MKQKYLISVIVPVYNVRDYLEECLDSVTGQTLGFENIQLILVNDGSKDGSGAICERYCREYPDNVVYIEQENSGVAVARNNGLSRAEGELVTFLDGDDKWSADSFKTAWEAYSRDPGIAVFSCKMVFFDADSGDHQLNYKYEEDRVVDIREDYNCPQLSSSSVFIRADIAKKHSFTPGIRYSEDFRYINEILLESSRMMLLKDPVYWYRRRQSNDSAIQASVYDRDYYIPTCESVYRYLFDRSLSEYGYVLRYLQFCVMYDLRWRLKIPFAETGLSEEEQAAYVELVRGLLRQIDDDIILDQKRIALAVQLFALELKHGEDVSKKYVADDSGAIRYDGRVIFDLSKRAVFRIEDLSLSGETLSVRGCATIPFHEERFRLLYSLNGSVKEVPLTDTDKNAKPYLYGTIRFDHAFAIEESVDSSSISDLVFLVEYDSKVFASRPKFATSGPLDKKRGSLKSGSCLICRRDHGVTVSRYSALKQLSQLFRI